MADSDIKKLDESLQKQLESSRKETRDGLEALYKTAQETLKTTTGDSKEAKKARKDATALAAKALKQKMLLII